MKKNVLLLWLAFGYAFVTAQVVWNKRLPVSNFGASFGISASRLNESNFLLSSSNQFLELDREGIVIGLQEGSQISSYLLSNYLQKRTDPISGNPFFLMGWRNITNTPYHLAYYKPNEGGWQTILSFGLGEVGNPGSRGPAILELNDTSLLVFTKSFVRKIACPRDTLWIEWVKPLTLAALNFPNAAIEHNGVTVFVTTGGEVSAVNAEGFQIWIRTYSAFIFRGIAKIGADFVACGADTSGHAALVKLDSDGHLIWEKTFSEDLEFNALTVAQDGNLAVTGKSADGNIPLLKTSQNGDLLWRKTFQKGLGATVMATPDAGYFLTGGGNQSGFYGIKTNGMGETSTLDNRALFRDRYLNNGGLSVTQFPSSSLFLHDYSSNFFLPADSNTTTLFTHSPWLAGLDDESILHLSASTYGASFENDYKMGIVSGAQKDFNRLWSVTLQEVSKIRRDWGEDGDLDNPVPFDLLTWPAKRNPHFVQNLDFSMVTTQPDSFPAPFIDKNGDGLYNVYDGDYPKLKGDRMLWLVINDQTIHAETHSIPLGVDILISIYAYDCAQTGSVWQSLFSEYQIINRSNKNYSDTYLGFYTDPDLGCPDDDYLGSLPNENSYYVYNDDAFDGAPANSCVLGPTSYGDKIPVQSISLLNHPMDHFIATRNHGLVETPGETDPLSAQEFYRYLKSIWRDGTPLSFGNTGYDPFNPSPILTNFIYPDSPNDPNGWSMCTTNQTLNFNKLISSHGPFSFASGDTFTMQLAFSFHPDIPHPCPDITTLVKPTIQQIQQWHDDGTLDAHLDLGSVLTLTPGQSLLLNATQQNPATSYAWSTGQNTPSIIVDQIGEYTVTITPASGCAYSETVLVKLASGTFSPTLPDWKVQPNPAHDVLKIVVEKAEMSITVLLHNAQGQLVATKNSSNNSLEISVANLPAGLYWAELWQDGQFLGSRKVVVAR